LAAGVAIEYADMRPGPGIRADDQIDPPIAVHIARGHEHPAREGFVKSEKAAERTGDVRDRVPAADDRCGAI
jgi:hypothetical protein